MSDSTKKKLFPNGQKYENPVRDKVTELMEESYKRVCGEGDFEQMKSQTMGENFISAIWFDFIKFQLTDHILETLNPKTFNITCKDGIDRAWAHSVYYNEQRNIQGNIKSEEKKSTSVNDELIHTPALIVKGRYMNKHNKNILELTRDKTEDVLAKKNNRSGARKVKAPFLEGKKIGIATFTKK